MKKKAIRSTILNSLGKFFHKRSIIVISDKKTNHFALSAKFQLTALFTVIGCVGWASYSTGSYMAARSVMKEQDQTIRSVANSRIDTNFNYFGPTVQPQQFTAVSNAVGVPLTDPAYTFTAVEQDKLYARISYLETKVKELRNTNEDIIHTVREKAHGKIADLEDIIRQTGLDPAQLKKQMSQQKKKGGKQNQDAENSATDEEATGGQGGPFIAEETLGATHPLGRELEVSLEQIALLSDVINMLPLAMPLKSAEQMSGYGRRIDPFNGRLAFHAGLDLTGPAGSKVFAVNAGKVVAAGNGGAYGNMVDIDHGFGIVTRYGHLSHVDVNVGDAVKRGQQVGVQGSTGRSTGPHLHYEVRYYDRPLDPRNFLTVGTNVSQE